jgi:hypothetical protein
MDEEMPKCGKCIFCKVLYIPPAKCYRAFTRVCGGKKNAYVCTLSVDEDNQVQFLGSDEGCCEMFTDKGVSK